jgi:hypothetical protein
MTKINAEIKANRDYMMEKLEAKADAALRETKTETETMNNGQKEMKAQVWFLTSKIDAKKQ